jgi:hypothetical protein
MSISGPKFKTYCRIMDYVEAVDPDLAELIHHTCADGSLGSYKGKSGITFLMPVDKAVRAKIEKLAASDKADEAIKACDMFNAMILRDVFKTPSDFKSREVVNALYPGQIVDVASTSATEVVFKNGAKAVLDTEFRDSSRRQALAVWKLTGEIPITTDRTAAPRPRVPKGKTGAYEVKDYSSQSERFKIAIAVENAYALCRLQHQIGDESRYRDVYVETVMSLMHHVLFVRKDLSVFVDAILPMISFDKLDFYLLVEPHRAAGQYLLDDSLIHEWWLQRKETRVDQHRVMAEIERCLTTNGNSAAVYSARANLLEKIAEHRQRLSQIAEGKPRGIVDEISKVYDELEQQNTIGGVGPVYPAPLAGYYAANPGLKMLHDELRYLTYGAFKRLEAGAFDIGEFNELLNIIGECFYAASADERAKAQKLLNKNTMKYMISPSEKVTEIKIFLFSTMFMYLPMTSAEATNLAQKYSVTRPNPANIVIFNISKDLYNRHQRVLEGSLGHASNSSIVAALKTLDPASLDPALLAMLREKFAAPSM